MPGIASAATLLDDEPLKTTAAKAAAKAGTDAVSPGGTVHDTVGAVVKTAETVTRSGAERLDPVGDTVAGAAEAVRPVTETVKSLTDAVEPVTDPVRNAVRPVVDTVEPLLGDQPRDTGRTPAVGSDGTAGRGRPAASDQPLRRSRVRGSAPGQTGGGAVRPQGRPDPAAAGAIGPTTAAGAAFDGADTGGTSAGQAILDAAQAFRFPLLVAAAVLLFLAGQSRLDRRDPRLAAGTDDEELHFA